MNQREYDRRRNQTPGRKMAASRRWRAESKAFLAMPGNATCAHCRAALATVVDHRIAHTGNLELFWDKRNWLPSCSSCNSRKAATSEGGFGRAPGSFEPKAKGADVSGGPLDRRHPWNAERGSA